MRQTRTQKMGGDKFEADISFVAGCVRFSFFCLFLSPKRKEKEGRKQ
jgi:hypothetical protein